jgi:hypothetical protein
MFSSRMALVQAPPPLPPPAKTLEEEDTPNPRTPVRGRQRNLFEAFGLSSEKCKKDDLQLESHKKLRKILSHTSLVNCQQEIEKLRDLEEIVKLQKAAKWRFARSQASWLILWWKGEELPRGASEQEGHEEASEWCQGRRRRAIGEVQDAQSFAEIQQLTRSLR